MHPDIRGKAGDACPICGMKLVPAPATDYQAYRLDLQLTPRAPRPGQPVRVRFFVRTPETGTIVRQFDTIHERLLHFFVIGHDLAYFTHVHPVLRGDGSFEQEIELPYAGAFRLVADFIPTGGAPQLLQQSIVTAGFTGPVLPHAKPPIDLADKTVGDTRVTLATPEPVGGREQLVTFDLADARTNAPIDDLEPFLGAPGHLLIVSADLQSVTHSHPVAEISTKVGPRVVFQVLFPRAGTYRMWAQFQRHGTVLTAPFTITARPRDQVFGR
jgi:hypothetical protein